MSKVLIPSPQPRGCTIPKNTTILGQCEEWTEQTPIPPPAPKIHVICLTCHLQVRIRYYTDRNRYHTSS